MSDFESTLSTLHQRLLVGDPSSNVNLGLQGQFANLQGMISHSGNFVPGQTNATFVVTITNKGNADNIGPTVVNFLTSAGLTITSISGTGWTTSLSPPSATRYDVIQPTLSYQTITVVCTVASLSPSQVELAAVISGSDSYNLNASTAYDTAGVVVPIWSPVMTHSGPAQQGQTGFLYTITITNSGSVPTSGLVTVLFSLPSVMIATALSGTGWTTGITPLQATRSDALAAGASYPTLTLTISFAYNTPANVSPGVVVSGGGAVAVAYYDSTQVLPVVPPNLTLSSTHVDTNIHQGDQETFTFTVTNNPAAGPSSSTTTVFIFLSASMTISGTPSGTGWVYSATPTPNMSYAGVISAGTSVSFNVVVNVVDASLSPGWVQAALTGGGDPTNPKAYFEYITVLSRPNACRVMLLNNVQAVANTAWTSVSFDTADFQTPTGMWSGISPTRISAPTVVGSTNTVYRVCGRATFASNSTGYRAIRILKSSATVVAQNDKSAINGDVTVLEINAVITLQAGNYVELQVWQNSGGSLNVQNDANGALTDFHVTRVQW